MARGANQQRSHQRHGAAGTAGPGVLGLGGQGPGTNQFLILKYYN